MEGLHYREKKISELSSKKDSRIALIGKVVETGESSFILDDNTGKVEIAYSGTVESNKLVRVFCSVIEDKLRADVVQDLKNFDLDLFFKVKELYIKSGV